MPTGARRLRIWPAAGAEAAGEVCRSGHQQSAPALLATCPQCRARQAGTCRTSTSLSLSWRGRDIESPETHTPILERFNTSPDAWESCSSGHGCIVPPQRQQASHVSGLTPMVAKAHLRLGCLGHLAVLHQTWQPSRLAWTCRAHGSANGTCRGCRPQSEASLASLGQDHVGSQPEVSSSGTSSGPADGRGRKMKRQASRLPVPRGRPRDPAGFQVPAWPIK